MKLILSQSSPKSATRFAMTSKDKGLDDLWKNLLIRDYHYPQIERMLIQKNNI
jgi:hypothetical protein